MELKPLGRPPAAPQAARSQNPQAQTRATNDSLRNAQDRILRAEEAVKEAEINSQNRIEEKREEYTVQSAKESGRQAESLETSRRENYEQIRRMQMDHARNVDRVRRQQEEEMAQLKQSLENQTHLEVTRGKETLEQMQSTNQELERFQKRNHDLKEQSVQLGHSDRMESLRSTSDQLFEQERMNRDRKLEFERNATFRSGEAAEEKFTKIHQEILGRHNAVLADTYHRSQEKLTNLQEDSSIRLDAYARRNADPFYRMVEVDGDLSEHRDAFVLKIDIPPHEQENVQVTVRGNEVVVSGNRRNNEERKNDDGTRVTTAAYQTFSQSYPLSYPVDSRSVQREYDGSTLKVTFPKLPSYANQNAYKAKPRTPDLVRVERPSFPGYLPLEGEGLQAKTFERDDSKAPQIKTPRRPAGKTLA